jgi:hypothetical protein
MKRLRELLEGVKMAGGHSKPRALFLFMDSEAKPDTEVCSGQFPSHLKGKPCPFSDHGRMPKVTESQGDPEIDHCSTEPEFLRAHPCMLQKLGQLNQWREEVPLVFQNELAHKILYKCRQMFLLVLL